MDVLKNEFRWENFKLTVPKSSQLYLSKICLITPCWIVVIRTILAVFYTGVCISSLARARSWIDLFFLTEVNYTVVTLFFLVNWVVSIICLRTTSCHYKAAEETVESGSTYDNDTSETQPLIRQCNSTSGWYCHLYKLNWLLFNISTSVSVAIVIIFWTLVNVDDRVPSGYIGYLVVEQHGLLLISILINFLLGTPPVRILHVIYPMIFAWIYVGTVAILWKTNGFVPYAILDFSNINVTLPTCFIAICVGLPIIHLSVFGFYHAKLWVMKRRNNRIRVELHEEVPT